MKRPSTGSTESWISDQLRTTFTSLVYISGDAANPQGGQSHRSPMSSLTKKTRNKGVFFNHRHVHVRNVKRVIIRPNQSIRAVKPGCHYVIRQVANYSLANQRQQQQRQQRQPAPHIKQAAAPPHFLPMLISSLPSHHVCRLLLHTVLAAKPPQVKLATKTVISYQ